jgi:hypothetical protein
MTGLHNVSGIDEVFSNRAARNKTSLVGMDEEGDKGTETES